MGYETNHVYLAGSACINVLIAALGISVAFLAWQVTEMTETDILPVTQLHQDWNHVPYTSIELSKEECPTKEVFERTWGGTEVGCYEVNYLSRSEVLP